LRKSCDESLTNSQLNFENRLLVNGELHRSCLPRSGAIGWVAEADDPARALDEVMTSLETLLNGLC